jgi:XisH protein
VYMCSTIESLKSAPYNAIEGTMPQRDLYHDQVRRALIAEGWTITSDPYYLTFGGERGYVDLGALATLAASLQQRQIAVEIKGFLGPSTMADLQQAVGQYLVYASWMRRIDPTRELWLAISEDTYSDVFDRVAAQAVVDDYRIRLLVVDVEAERVRAWKP